MAEETDYPLTTTKRGLSLEEFCKLYGTGRTLAYEEIKAGRLRARKVGRRTVITRDDAEAWLHNLPPIEMREAPPRLYSRATSRTRKGT